jgi:hypothetical protein
MARPIKPGARPTDLKLNLSADQRSILETLGNGNMSQGIRVAIDQAAHFYNCGLDPDMNLNYIGLVTVLPGQDDD